jgi:hypothetical protein
VCYLTPKGYREKLAFRRRFPSCLARIFGQGADLRFWLILLPLIATERAFTQTPLPTKTVLILFDEHTDLPGLAVLNTSILSTLNADPSIKTDVYTESMNLSRFQRDGYEDFLRDYYREKYKGKKIDVVIAALSPSLSFALAHMQEIAPGAPIVFCGVDPSEIAGKDLGKNITGVLVKRDFTGTLDAALKMQPDTRKVVFIGGSSAFDRQLTGVATEQLKPYENRVSISYLTDQPLDNILKTVSQLPLTRLCSTPLSLRTEPESRSSLTRLRQRISDAANVPVYGFLDQYLGRGIVGGHLYSLNYKDRKRPSRRSGYCMVRVWRIFL